MLERKKAAAARDIVAQQSGPLSASSMIDGQLSLSSGQATIPWTQALPTIPMIDPNQYWDSHSSDYSRLIPGAAVEQSSPYLSTHYSPLTESNQELHSSPSSPPPFQFTSSSLSSALSIPSRNLLHVDAGSPSQILSPIIPQSNSPSSLPNTELHDPHPCDSPLHDTTLDAATTDIERHTHDTERLVEAEQSQDGAAGRASSPVNRSELPLIFTSSPSGQITSLSRVSPDSSSGTSGEDHMVSSPLLSNSHYRIPAEDPAGFHIQSLSLVSANAVGTAGEDSNILSPSVTTTGSYYRTPAEKASRPPAPRRRHDRDGTQPRLSSKLAAASEYVVRLCCSEHYSFPVSILAYACGHPQCWPSDATDSLQCFHTSQELSDHWKVKHSSDDVGSNSFRCSLAGCGKGWKVGGICHDVIIVGILIDHYFNIRALMAFNTTCKCDCLFVDF